MTIKTDVKAGFKIGNHNETLAVRSNVKAGIGGWGSYNHNETLAVRSNVEAGGKSLNHNESFRR